MDLTVLTGDIVDSSALSAEDLDGTLLAVQSACADFERWTNAPAGFARRGGDSWQIAIQDTRLELRACLYVQATLRRLHKDRATRISVATGEGNLPPVGDTNTAHGPAFTASGRLLEKLPKNVLMAHAAGGAKSATLLLADHIAQGWTEAQAAALCELLPPGAGPRAKAAERLNKTRQAINQALWSAGFPALDAAMTAWEAA